VFSGRRRPLFREWNFELGPDGGASDDRRGQVDVDDVVLPNRISGDEVLLREQNPRLMVKIGMGFLLVFFLMRILPHPTSRFGDGLYDGVRGALMGAGATLLLWATYLNGQRRRDKQAQ
jgi:hypothetical protein